MMNSLGTYLEKMPMMTLVMQELMKMVMAEMEQMDMLEKVEVIF